MNKDTENRLREQLDALQLSCHSLLHSIKGANSDNLLGMEPNQVAEETIEELLMASKEMAWEIDKVYKNISDDENFRLENCELKSLLDSFNKDHDAFQGKIVDFSIDDREFQKWLEAHEHQIHKLIQTIETYNWTHKASQAKYAPLMHQLDPKKYEPSQMKEIKKCHEATDEEISGRSKILKRQIYSQDIKIKKNSNGN